ncbi:hypothetical protein [Streptomyces sp. NPDC055607]
MRPRLLPQTDIVRLDGDRVCLRNAHRVVEFGTAPLFPLLSKLAPRLDGAHTVEEITANLDARHGELVADLVRKLGASGLVRDLTGVPPRGDGGIGYIDTYVPDAEELFERFRRLRTLVIGSGSALESCLRAARIAGLERISVIDTARPGYAGFGGDRAGRAPDVRGFDAVLHLADGSSVLRARRVEEACDTHGAVLVTAVVLAHEAWLGPVAAAGGGSWHGTWESLRPSPVPAEDGEGATDAAAPWRPGREGIGAHLVHSLFAHTTRSSERDWSRCVTRLDLRTGETSFHPARPRPGRGSGADARVPDEESSSVAGVVDRWTGPVVEAGEEDLPQFPLNVSRAVAAGVDGTSGAVVHAAGPDLATARLRAVRAAAERRALAVTGASAAAAGDGVLGVDLLTGAVVVVDATTLLDARGAEGTAVPGLASGHDRAEALVNGLLSWSEEIAARGDGTAAPSPRPVRADLFTHDPAVVHLQTLLTIAGFGAVCHDDSHRLGIPTYTVRCEGVTVARACGLSAEDAMRSALERTLLWWQSRTSGRPVCTPPAPAGPASMTTGPPTYTLPRPIAPHDADRVLSRRLDRLGHRFAAVPLDRDPALRAFLPHAVRLVPSRV